MLQTVSSAQQTADQGLVGVVDVGSNSVRLVVYEDGVRCPDYVFNEKTICRLGEGLGATGRLNPEGRARALRTIKRFMNLARAMGVAEVIGLGTAAMREADDAPEFRDLIAAETGLEIRVATGREEARLSAEGVLFGWPDVEGVIADIGGSSLELAAVADGRVGSVISTPAGHLRLRDAGEEEAASALRALDIAAGTFAPLDGPLVLVGGAWRGLAKAEMSRRGYPLHVLMGYEIAPEAALELCDWALTAPPAALKKAAGASQARVGSIAGGAIALKRLVETLSPKGLVVSAYGLREGLVHERMAPELRAQPPLLTAAARMEARSARSPGFGEELFAWLSPLIEPFPENWRALTHAACHLHDVNWRAHPDFRAAACFATVARANLSGVGHKGRLFIGAALLYRYKWPEATPEISAMLKLLPEAELKAAETVGRALRLGAMLTGSVRGLLGQIRLERAEDELVLTLEPAVADLAGERVERRLEALADTLGLGARLVA